MMVAILTIEQAESLAGQYYDASDSSVFMPQLDANGNYVITEAEINACVKPAFDWVHSLPLTEFLPPEEIFI